MRFGSGRPGCGASTCGLRKKLYVRNFGLIFVPQTYKKNKLHTFGTAGEARRLIKVPIIRTLFRAEYESKWQNLAKIRFFTILAALVSLWLGMQRLCA